ncbi:hypothetical protein [Nocardia sp. CA-119907]|uniref:hypothetical protein n=1 Tax=Nocardia sp. CA-119907 TaxID=3239973 RepID=UPI003D97AADD
MQETPFWDAANRIAQTMDYQDMAHRSDRARSHGWWRNLVEYGPWKGPAGRVSPPDPDALSGIAKLFGTSEGQVRAMIAADWYGVQQNTEISARVLRLGPLFEQLTDEDADLAEKLIRRLSQQRQQSESSLKRKSMSSLKRKAPHPDTANDRE